MTHSSSHDKAAYHHGNLRQALLSHAFDVIAEHGTSKLTLRELARRAGVSHGAIPALLPTKRSFLALSLQKPFATFDPS